MADYLIKCERCGGSGYAAPPAVHRCPADRASAVVGDGRAAAGFRVRRAPGAPAPKGRVAWKYTVTSGGALLSKGTDLWTPDYATADEALSSLLAFAYSASESREPTGFAPRAVQAFAALSDEIGMALLEREEA